MSNPYESQELLDQYLLFHFGTKADILPSEWDLPGWAYPTDCAEKVIAQVTGNKGRALDLGCSVGRSSFELARHMNEVVGIDFSHAFIDAANAMKESGEVSVIRRDEGDRSTPLKLALDPAIDRSRTHFEHGDACNLRDDLGTFDAILMANLVDRVPDPMACLRRIPSLLNIGGTVVITSPYTWLESYTPRENWLSLPEQSAAQALERALPELQLVEQSNMPFLIREHARKYQWSLAECTVWQKNV